MAYLIASSFSRAARFLKLSNPPGYGARDHESGRDPPVTGGRSLHPLLNRGVLAHLHRDGFTLLRFSASLVLLMSYELQLKLGRRVAGVEPTKLRTSSISRLRTACAPFPRSPARSASHFEPEFIPVTIERFRTPSV